MNMDWFFPDFMRIIFSIDWFGVYKSKLRLIKNYKISKNTKKITKLQFLEVIKHQNHYGSIFYCSFTFFQKLENFFISISHPLQTLLSPLFSRFSGTRHSAPGAGTTITTFFPAPPPGSATRDPVPGDSKRALSL